MDLNLITIGVLVLLAIGLIVYSVWPRKPEGRDAVKRRLAGRRGVDEEAQIRAAARDTATANLVKKATPMLNRLIMPTSNVEQTNLRVKLGFNMWLAGDGVPDFFGVSQLAGINPMNIGAAGGVNVMNQIPFVTDKNGLPLTSTPTLSFGFPRVQMQVFIQALRENKLLKVLAEPNLVTISGQEASFLAGGEFPIPVPQGGTNNAITVEFREFGVRLHFTPTVLGENTIRLHVAPEVSEPDYSSAITLQGYVVPGLTQRRVDTVVELGPGQTFALGGLLSDRMRAIGYAVPVLGDIPVLGALFSSVGCQAAGTGLGGLGTRF